MKVLKSLQCEAVYNYLYDLWTHKNLIILVSYLVDSLLIFHLNPQLLTLHIWIIQVSFANVVIHLFARGTHFGCQKAQHFIGFQTVFTTGVISTVQSPFRYLQYNSLTFTYYQRSPASSLFFYYMIIWLYDRKSNFFNAKYIFLNIYKYLYLFNHINVSKFPPTHIFILYYALWILK